MDTDRGESKVQEIVVLMQISEETVEGRPRAMAPAPAGGVPELLLPQGVAMLVEADDQDVMDQLEFEGINQQAQQIEDVDINEAGPSGGVTQAVPAAELVAMNIEPADVVEIVEADGNDVEVPKTSGNKRVYVAMDLPGYDLGAGHSQQSAGSGIAVEMTMEAPLEVANKKMKLTHCPPPSTTARPTGNNVFAVPSTSGLKRSGSTFPEPEPKRQLIAEQFFSRQQSAPDLLASIEAVAAQVSAAGTSRGCHHSSPQQFQADSDMSDQHVDSDAEDAPTQEPTPGASSWSSRLLLRVVCKCRRRERWRLGNQKAGKKCPCTKRALSRLNSLTQLRSELSILSVDTSSLTTEPQLFPFFDSELSSLSSWDTDSDDTSSSASSDDDVAMERKKRLLKKKMLNRKTRK